MTETPCPHSRVQHVEIQRDECLECGATLAKAVNVAAQPASARTGAGGWQPIETAPKDMTRVLVWNGESREIAFYGASVNNFKWRRDTVAQC